MSCAVPGCPKRHYALGLCSAHYTRRRRHGTPTGGGVAPGDLRRFLVEAVASSTDNCILWPYGKANGYGTLRVAGRRYLAHRLALEMAVGPAPAEGMHAAHQPVVCHEPACVNPRHLRWASKVENEADKAFDETMPRGEQNPNAKLTDAQVLAIRRDWRRLADVAADYGVSRMTISRIRRRQLWPHLEEVA